MNYRVGIEVLIKKGLFFYDICTTKTHRKRGSFIVCCFLIVLKKNLNSSVNLNSKAPSIRRSESRIVVADVSVILSTPMSKNTRKRRKKHVLVLLNFHNRGIIDILKDRDKHTLSSYFYRIPRKERDKVDYVSIDLTDNYRDILRTFLPHAIIIADSFHVMKHLVDALDDVRLRTLRRFNDKKKSDEYYLLKYRNELLYAIDVDYTPKTNKHFRRYLSQDQLLSMMVSLDKELHDAYILYPMYHRFNQTEFLDLKEAENQLLEIINRFTISGISEFQALASTLFNWKTEIVNSFSIYKDRRVSNGPIEGRNSWIKKILRLANGYSNFERFRNRVIYCLNRHSTHSFK